MRKFWALMLVALVAALTAVPAFAQSGTAKVRVIHASPDAPAVDVIVNGSRALTNVPFFTASDYLDLPAGSYDIQVVPTGASTPVVIDAKGVRIEAGKAYTIAATGPLASIKPTVLVDNLAAPAAGNAKVRVYHFSPDAPAVDIKAGGTTIIPNLAFPNASDYLEVPAGSYDLTVTPAGQSAVVLNLPGTRLEAGKIYDVFATNFVASLTPQIATPTPLAASAPATLPTTSGESLPLVAVALGAALLAAAGLTLRRVAR